VCIVDNEMPADDSAIELKLVRHLQKGGTTVGFMALHPGLSQSHVNSLLERITDYPRLVERVERLHSKRPRCVVGESLVAAWVRGKFTEDGDEFDVLARNGQCIEVKYSALNAQGGTRRSSWRKIYGEQGRKKYDRLILIGDWDERYSRLYGDTQSPFVIFDVPFREVRPLTIDGGKWKLVQRTSDPRTAKSRASRLFSDYLVSEAEVEARYGTS
jgi:hypothetical protein